MDWVFFLIKFIVAFVMLNGALTLVAFLVYFERKVAAHMQARMGPNRAGPLGLLQSFADLIKMLKKEDTIPKGADRVVFWAAPVVSTLAAVGVLAFIPFGPPANLPGYLDVGRPTDWFLVDVNVGAVAILAMSSLGVYGLIMAGWSSNSKYSLLGGLRSSSQVISYEITLGISLIGVFLLSGSLSLVEITRAQNPFINQPGTPGLWFILFQPLGFMAFLVSATAETNRTPFDLPEAETELVAGFHTEYSGTRFMLFFLAEYVGVLTASALMAIMFFGGWGSPFGVFFDRSNIPFISGLLGSGPHWIVLKIAFFIFLFYWLRWTLPRFRYDQLMGLSWKVFLPLILVNIMVIGVLKLLFFPPGTDPANYSLLFWLILAAIELAIGFLALYGFSRVAGLGWFGKAERPMLVERPLILVRTVHGGRGTIEGEARVVKT